MKMRYIPNVLSLSRIPVSAALPFLAVREGKGWMIAFLVCYIIAGVNDVLDGIIARRFHWESKLGAKFDSIGDGVFIVCVVIAAILTLGPSLGKNGLAFYNYIIFAVFAAFKVANVIATRAKFKQWGFIHLRSARWSVIPLYIVFPIFIRLHTVVDELVAVCLVLSIIALVEEVCILALMKKDEYTMNIKSVFEWKRDMRRAALTLEAESAQKEEAQV